jgi:hypothetical protein
MMYGYIVLNGNQYPIVDIQLFNQQVKLRFDLRGPIDPFESPITVLDQNGNAMFQGSLLRVKAGLSSSDLRQCWYGLRIVQIMEDRVFEY